MNYKFRWIIILLRYFYFFFEGLRKNGPWCTLHDVRFSSYIYARYNVETQHNIIHNTTLVTKYISTMHSIKKKPKLKEHTAPLHGGACCSVLHALNMMGQKSIFCIELLSLNKNVWPVWARYNSSIFPDERQIDKFLI
jgi:hypothetical protein